MSRAAQRSHRPIDRNHLILARYTRETPLFATARPLVGGARDGYNRCVIRERVGRDDQIGGIMPVRLDNGVRAAQITSCGGIDALIVLDRAMDVAHCAFGGVPLVWHGPGGIQPPHPGTMNDDTFERRFFGGLVTTCGLGAFGPAGSDVDGSWGQHGHINHCAAEEIEMRVDIESEDAFVTLRGVIRQARMFGESLRLDRTWTMSRGGTVLRLNDRITNEGGTAVPHMLLYHCNAGYPLLDESTRVSISQTAVRPRDEQARAGLAVWDCGAPPDPQFKEQVFIHDPVAGDDGWATARIENRERRLWFEVGFRPDQLPACFSWRMLGVRRYVMAVEPANCPTIAGRVAAREAGTLPMLAAGESREYQLIFRFGDQKDKPVRA